MNVVNLRAKCAASDLYQRAPLSMIAVDKFLAANGVDPAHVENLVGPIIPCMVDFHHEGRFRYCDLGDEGLVFAVLGDDAEHEIDLVAFSLQYPPLFGTLLNQAAALGSYNILDKASFYGGKPCPLWRTPLRWMRERCEGACVIDAIEAATIIARAPGKWFLAEDIDHARSLVRSRAVPRDRLMLPDNDGEKAAS